jgi:hypothetical protein
MLAVGTIIKNYLKKNFYRYTWRQADYGQCSTQRSITSGRLGADADWRVISIEYMDVSEFQNTAINLHRSRCIVKPGTTDVIACNVEH